MARVLVQHVVRKDANGNVTGVRHNNSGQVVLNLTHIYKHRDEMGNMVGRVSCGDTWSIRPVNNNSYEFVTV